MLLGRRYAWRLLVLVVAELGGEQKWENDQLGDMVNFDVWFELLLGTYDE